MKTILAIVAIAALAFGIYKWYGDVVFEPAAKGIAGQVDEFKNAKDDIAKMQKQLNAAPQNVERAVTEQ